MISYLKRLFLATNKIFVRFLLVILTPNKNSELVHDLFLSLVIALLNIETELKHFKCKRIK